MRRLVLAALILAPTAAHANQFAPLVKAMQEHMAIAYWCRDYIGGAFYLAAKTGAIETTAAVMPRNQAILAVDKAEQDIKKYPAIPELTADFCLQSFNEAADRLRTEKAKLGLN